MIHFLFELYDIIKAVLLFINVSIYIEYAFKLFIFKNFVCFLLAAIILRLRYHLIYLLQFFFQINIKFNTWIRQIMKLL